ncbi:MAG: ribonuclease N [Deltaproteobacteria bacterium]|nr:ribonuclease N [Deltaproteobacteria bacterium]
MDAFKKGVCIAVLLALTIWGGLSWAKDAASNSGGAENTSREIRTIKIMDLPDQALATLKLIKAGGPFPYSQDGIIFGNREKRLPRQPHGYYKEYTVKTPARSDRGPRRIVAGANGDFYYTDDHYQTFKLIKE